MFFGRESIPLRKLRSSPCGVTWVWIACAPSGVWTTEMATEVPRMPAWRAFIHRQTGRSEGEGATPRRAVRRGSEGPIGVVIIVIVVAVVVVCRFVGRQVCASVRLGRYADHGLASMLWNVNVGDLAPRPRYLSSLHLNRLSFTTPLVVLLLASFYQKQSKAKQSIKTQTTKRYLAHVSATRSTCIRRRKWNRLMSQ